MFGLLNTKESDKTHRTAEITGAWDSGFVPAQATASSGFAAGTLVATQNGWQDVALVQAGDQVLTFDGGLQTVKSIRKELAWQDDFFCPEHLWPMHIPAGTLGNREAMTLMPDQTILIESDIAEEVFGDPFTLVKAEALEGYRGISRDRPATIFEVFTLVFETEQLAFAHSGALMHCPGDKEAEESYIVLDGEEAEMLIDTLDMLDRQNQGHTNPAMVA
ncbi:Hint domain-containing protein [Algirhabdus cladophorae]|uniref:Hint domain-containing protein n=1 Tax=Algirhabdus cladophorae TaxID=3377108 RepID=UPI003B847AFD